MVRNLFLLLLLLGSIALQAQSNEIYHRVRIRLEGKSMTALAALGIETDHGEYVPQRHLTNDLSEDEMRRLTEAGFTYEVLISDINEYYRNPDRRAAVDALLNTGRGGDTCPDDTGNDGGVFDYPIPTNFRLGDMAGFYRYAELLDILDSMRLLYPDLITARQIVSPNITTHEGRPIYWLRISDNPDTDEATEPEVFYNAIHHAREPNGLTQMVFYMWYLLENYDTNPEVQYLVNNTEMYFIPVLNPDGYIYNEIIEPDGGGLWRKNRRDNEDGNFGVDLNRNYGYEWGYDDSGSSPNTGSQTYRGPEAFSEPETQAARFFCNEHEFVVALNYHTFGNLLIYPWGYSDTPTEDAPTFNTLARLMTQQNNYLAGTGTETVGYTVNGDSDDWMYGEAVEKNQIFSMTPEVGTGGFWPAREDIIPNSQACIWMNLIAAHTPLNSGVATPDPTQNELAAEDAWLRYDLQRFGRTPGELTVGLESLNPAWVTVAEEPATFNLDENELVADSFALVFAADIPTGVELQFVLHVDNGTFVRQDTFSRIYGDYMNTTVFDDPLTTQDSWAVDGDWGLTTESFVSAPTSLTDSPFSDYENNSTTQALLVNPITVGEAEEYLLQFWTRWDLESFYDYAQLHFSVNGGPWIPACGLYTVSGSEAQALGEPVWEGISLWVQEQIDLTPYVSAGDAISLRYTLVADTWVNQDGFYVDDISLLERNPMSVDTRNLVNPDEFQLTIIPNPSYGNTVLQFRTPSGQAATGQWTLFHADGQQLQQGQLDLPQGFGQVPLSLTALTPGVYYLQANINGQLLQARKLVIID